MTGNKTKHILRKTAAGLTAIFAVVFFSFNVMATPSTSLYINGSLPLCTQNQQKRGGGACLERQNAKSCINTTPFSPIGGVSSEMCARGREWCDRNDPHGTHNRCKNVYEKGLVKNHQGYDYSAACRSSIFAPCDGTSKYNASSSTKPITFTCTICGKKYEYTFHHTSGTVGNGEFKKGDLIGFSGNATGYPCHMHIEIRQDKLLMDPMYPGFDEEVCSCTDTEKVNRDACFDSNSAEAKDKTKPDTGYQYSNVDTQYSDALSTAGLDTFKGKDNPNDSCIYANVLQNYSTENCLFCTPFKIMFNTASIIAKKAFEALSRSVYIVVMIAFAIWLALTIMRFVSHFEIRDPRNMIKILLHQSFKVLFVVILLVGAQNGGNLLSHLLEMTVDPVFNTGIKIAQLGGSIAAGESVDSSALVNTSPDKTSAYGITNEGALSVQMGDGILGTIKSIQDKILEIMAIARVAFCLSWEHCPIKKASLGTTCLLFPHLGYFITGIGFFVTSFLLLLIYPWLLVDTLLRMAVITAFLPAAVGGWAFKPTSQYIKKVWAAFLDVMFTFMFMSMVILIIAVVAKAAAADIINPYVERGVFIGNIMWWSVAACKVMFICFLGFAVLPQTKDFAKKFTESIAGAGASALSKDIGSRTGSGAMAVARGAVTNYVAPAAEGIGRWGLDMAAENLSHYGRKLRSDYSGEGDDNAGGDDDSGDDDDFDATDLTDEGIDISAQNTQKQNRVPFKETGTKVYSAWRNLKQGASRKANNVLDKFRINTGEDKHWIVKDLNKLNSSLHTYPGENTFHEYADGNIMQVNTVTFADGSQLITKTDDYAMVKIHRTAGGKETIYSAELKSETKKIVKRRRKIDTSKLQALRQIEAWDDKEKAMIIMSSIVGSRMGNYEGGKLDGAISGREITQGISDNGSFEIVISQTNQDGSKTVFTASIVGDLALNTVTTDYGKGNSISYKTDGTIQRITDVTDGKTTQVYSVSDEFSSLTAHPIHLNGTVSDVLGRSNILFSDEELKDFAKQVEREGADSAFQQFTSFKN